MVDHIETRLEVLRALREELVGPSPQGTEIDCSGDLNFANAADSFGPFRQAVTGEEILLRDPPTKRYGVGLLHPAGISVEEEPDGSASDGHDPVDQPDTTQSKISDELQKTLDEISARKGLGSERERESEDLDLSATNAFKPSSMGISFLCRVPKGSKIVVRATGGRYKRKRVHVGTTERIWWLREPVTLEAEFSADNFKESSNSFINPETKKTSAPDMALTIELYSRPQVGSNEYLLTICLVNRERASTSAPESCLFQSEFSVTLTGGSVLPYPSGKGGRVPDDEELSLMLLYRKTQTYAVGHGCAANWLSDENGVVSFIRGENLPAFETPSMTPNVERADGSAVNVSMAELAGLVEGRDGFSSLDEVLNLYSEWIDHRRVEAEELDDSFRATAESHIADCEKALARMREGLDFLNSNERARLAFQLANEAILIQQARSRRDARRLSFNTRLKRLEFSEDYPVIDLLMITGRGHWRAFQIAFLLMSIRSAVDPTATDRDTVELIWFPTGGGKTEAYLGLAAFALFFRRLEEPEDGGTHVIMRYTLRLLTAQQFQRAAGLLCAMEGIRRKHVDALGNNEFSIGIWLGSQTTPNSRKEAVDNFKELTKGTAGVENKFILTRCPWCSAQLGPIKYSGRVPHGAPRVTGYAISGNGVIIKCSDSSCIFKDKLPVYVIDEDIYEARPSLVIGTVDKFAILAWKPEARSLFGLGPDGTHSYRPPGLIIQDELHLISGPLGSMYGLYEVAIDELCTDRRNNQVLRPKIVSSTATIRRYEHQIKALYGRNDVSLFPSPGLEDGDSFFARYARNEDKSLSHGRMYVGVHAPALGSMQTVQVRTFSALLQAPVRLTTDERDPWWTLVLFFNSLRELGTTLTLFQSDIPDYFGVLKNRFGLKPEEVRNYGQLNIKELTGRLRSDEVPEAIDALEVTSSGDFPVDVCLASNIIEVGIDIDRLSLMCIVGQPKTTSQYIQVSGRVGRAWSVRPGLVVTLYGSSKARDRSHFEKFRSYHEKLYAQVEPTSVTPFSPPVLDRALHAALVVFARQAGDDAIAKSPYPFPASLVDRFKDILENRVGVVDADESANLTSVFNRRRNQWEQWKRTEWERDKESSDMSLLRRAGAFVTAADAKLSWPTPTSLRNVDAECQTEITQLYLTEELESD